MSIPTITTKQILKFVKTVLTSNILYVNLYNSTKIETRLLKK